MGNVQEIYGMYAHKKVRGLMNGLGVSTWYTGTPVIFQVHFVFFLRDEPMKFLFTSVNFLFLVLLNDMDKVEVAPSEMFSRLGMLVVESRVPHPSAKGRTGGPHCPSSPGDGPHHQCRPQSSPLVSTELNV